MTRWADTQNGNGSAGAVPVRRPLGQLALEAGLITNEQLASAIADIQVTGKRLGEVLVSRGLLDELQLSQLLELQEGAEPVPFMGRDGDGEDDEPDEAEPEAELPPAAVAAPPAPAPVEEPAEPARPAKGRGKAARTEEPAPAPAPQTVVVAQELNEELLAAIRQDMVDLLLEVEQRTTASAEDAARTAQLDERMAALQGALEQRDVQILALRDELNTAREELAAAREEVAQSRSGVGEQLARNAELQEKMAEARAAAQAHEREVAAARQEVQRLTQVIEQRDAKERSVRATLEQLTSQLAPLD